MAGATKRGRGGLALGVAVVALVLASAPTARASSASAVLGGIQQRIREAAPFGGGLSTGSAQDSDAKGVATTPNERFVLISKPQPDGRWMISLESSTGQVQGNVLTTDGAVVFLWCDVVDAWGDGEIETSGLVFDCSTTTDGTSWFIIASGVRVPATFFLP